jgi:cation diffusion facilitator CzcD-associated flavoprotein CzcO
MANDTTTTPLTETDVIVIGTGFSGLAMATTLAREGTRSFVMLERAGDIGGTWRDNDYPGAACDIQSHLYSFSFRPNPDWSRVYAGQWEIFEYLRATARDEGLMPHIRFDSEVLRAEWIADRGVWSVHTPNGRHEAAVLVTASGHLSDPAYPDIPGFDEFKGALFHSARWNRDYDWSGKRVGVIGTGASAIQIVPELAKESAELSVFQRSAPYVIPRRDRLYTDAEKRMFRRLPETAQALRDELFWGNEARFPQRRGVPSFINEIAGVANGHREAQVTDPALQEKLTPHYEIGCKRILISNDYYPTLALPHVTLEVAGIERIDATGVVMKDGRHIDLDLLVVATGFEATDLPIAHRVFGTAGSPLADHWADGGHALACTAVNGFPNLFVMLGPNTGLGAGSMIYMVETQAAYIRGAIDYLFEHDVTIEPDAIAERDYVASIDRRAEGSVWLAGGCNSWYLHPKSGRLTTLWPDFMTRFRIENGTFRSEGYTISPSTTRTLVG